MLLLQVVAVLYHNVAHFSPWRIIVKIDNIAWNEKTIAQKKNIKVIYTQD